MFCGFCICCYPLLCFAMFAVPGTSRHHPRGVTSSGTLVGLMWYLLDCMVPHNDQELEKLTTTPHSLTALPQRSAVNKEINTRNSTSLRFFVYFFVVSFRVFCSTLKSGDRRFGFLVKNCIYRQLGKSKKLQKTYPADYIYSLARGIRICGQKPPILNKKPGN